MKSVVREGGLGEPFLVAELEVRRVMGLPTLGE